MASELSLSSVWANRTPNFMVERVEKSIWIRVGEAKEIKSASEFGLSCVLKINHEEVARTSTSWKTVMPFWGEEYWFQCPPKFRNFSIYVHYYDEKVEKDDILGKILFTRNELSLVPVNEQWYSIKPVPKSEVQGHVDVKTKYFPGKDSKPGSVQVFLYGAGQLAIMDANGFSDPYCKVIVTDSAGRQEQKSEVRKKTLNPSWDDIFEFEVMDDSSMDLQVVVYNRGRMGSDDFMGECLLNLGVQEMLAELPEGEEPPRMFIWRQYYELVEKGTSATIVTPTLNTSFSRGSLFGGSFTEIPKEVAPVNVGYLRLNVVYNECEVLFADYYSALQNALIASFHNVDTVVSEKNNLSDRITAISLLEMTLSSAMHRESIARALVRLFYKKGLVTDYISWILNNEVNNTADSNTLFRGNTLATKSVDAFMKLVCHYFLCDALQSFINRVFEEEKHCEVDPLKISKEGPGSNLETNHATLEGYLVDLIEAILSTASKCPPEMCAIFASLQNTVNERWTGDNANENVRYTSVSGFLFLRFFAPAVLSPKLYELRKDHPGAVVNRTLTLLSKALQNLGNFVKPSSKEEFMRPLSSLIENYIPKVKLYLDMLAKRGLSSNQSKLRKISLNCYVGAEELAKQTKLVQGAQLIKEGALLRRQQGSRLLGPPSYSKKHIKLTKDGLLYFKDKKSKEPKHVITKNNLLDAQKVDAKTFGKRNMFKVVQTDKTVYMVAGSLEEQEEWVAAFREVCVEVTTQLSRQGDNEAIDSAKESEIIHVHLYTHRTKLAEKRDDLIDKGQDYASVDELIGIVDDIKDRHVGIVIKDKLSHSASLSSLNAL